MATAQEPDLYLLCPDGRKVLCHRAVLSAASARLSSVLSNGFSGTQLPVQGVDSSALESVVSSFYTGSCHVTAQTLCPVFDAASKLEATTLADGCRRFVESNSLTADNCCTILHGALVHKTKQIMQPCMDFAVANFEDVTSSADYVTSPYDVILELLLASLEKQVPSDVVAEAASTWLKQEESRMELEQQLAESLGLTADALAQGRAESTRGAVRPPVEDQEVLLKVEAWGHLSEAGATLTSPNASSLLQHYGKQSADPGAVDAGAMDLQQAAPAGMQRGPHGAESPGALQSSLLALLGGAGGVQGMGAGMLQQLQMQVVSAAAAAAAAHPAEDAGQEEAAKHVSEGQHQEGQGEAMLGKRRRGDEEDGNGSGEDGGHPGDQQHLGADGGGSLSSADLLAALSGAAGSSEAQAGLMALLLQQQQRPVSCMQDASSMMMHQMTAAGGGGSNGGGGMEALKQLLSLTMDQQQQMASAQQPGGSGLSDEAMALQQLLASSGLSSGMTGIANSPNGTSLLLNSIRRMQQDQGQLSALSALSMGGSGGQEGMQGGMNMNMFGGGHLMGLQMGGGQGMMPYGMMSQQGGGMGQLTEDDGRRGGSSGKGNRQPRQAPMGAKGMCHVDNCNADLAGLREYHLRYKICEYHLKAPSILKDGLNQRFCQQCGRFHTLEAFDGNRRSCRTMLQRHNARRAKKGTNDGPSPQGGSGSGGPSAQATQASLATLNALTSSAMGEEFLRSMLQPMM